MPLEIIETPRLILRPPTPDDAESIFLSYASDPDVHRYLSRAPAQSVAEVERFLKAVVTDWTRGVLRQWVIVRRTDQWPIGMFNLRLDRHGGLIGYQLSRSTWGQGLAAEAGLAVTDAVFADPLVYRVWAFCDTENLPSVRVLEKLGMVREGLLRRFIRHPNIGPDPRDVYVYARVR